MTSHVTSGHVGSAGTTHTKDERVIRVSTENDEMEAALRQLAASADDAAPMDCVQVKHNKEAQTG